MTRKEEFLNAGSHYFGAVLALLALVLLVEKALSRGNSLYLVSGLVYSISLCYLYSISGSYHILREGRWKKFFQRLDHIAIYFLIAGSYTPYIFLILPSPKKWLLFAIQWGITLLGILFKVFFMGRFEAFSTALYLLMGWSVVLVFPELRANLPARSLYLLIASGVAYSIGVIPFCLEKIPYSHFVWHLFVLAGSLFGFLSIYTIVA